MNALRQRIADVLPYDNPDVAIFVLNNLAGAQMHLRTGMMDQISASCLAIGRQDPFDQRTREAVLDGGLDEDELSTD